MEKRDKMVDECAELFIIIDELCQGESFGAILAALMGMMSKILYHLPVDKRQIVLVDLEKIIREGIERVPELEEA